MIRSGLIGASLRAGDTELMMQDRASMANVLPGVFDDPGSVGVGSCALYFRVDDVEAMEESFDPSVEVVKSLETTWYGMAEIWIRDPDGYLVTVGSQSGSPPPI